MAEIITSPMAEEGGTYVLSLTIKDENGDPLVPSSLTWSLYDGERNIVNGREDVVISPTDSSVDIVMKNQDLLISESEEYKLKEMRIVRISGTYDSTYGDNLTLEKEARFYIVNMTDL